ncbi:hypothetical protein CDIK_1993 [Cucumispora dikerogammari]|nr:hypothetical protein CDIK_1993 [Cucumispora dikerogammari]
MKSHHVVKFTLDNLKPSLDNIRSLILFLALNLSNQPVESLYVSSERFLAISYAFNNGILSDSTPLFTSIIRTHSISFVSIILIVRSLLTFIFTTFSVTYLPIISASSKIKFAIELLAINFLKFKANFSATQACDAF